MKLIYSINNKDNNKKTTISSRNRETSNILLNVIL